MIIGLAGYTFRNGDINYNMIQMERAINECHRDVDLLCFGESFLQGFDALSWEYEKDKDIAISKDSDVMNELKEMSLTYHKDLAFGYIEKDNDKLYSSYAVIASGELVRNYRRVTKNWKEFTKTDEHYCEGTDTSSFLYKGVPVTIALCGDLWICPEKFVTDGLLLWPVYLGYTKEQWKTEKEEYAKQAFQVSRHTLLVNSISKNPKSVGGAMYFYDGRVAENLPFGKEGILETEIRLENVFDLNKFLDTYDTMCKEGKKKQLEGYLIDGMEQATKKGNLPVVFTIANELLGYYRVNGRITECLDCIDTVLFLAKLMGIEGSHQYAVTMINVATAYRVCRDYTQSLHCYQEADKLLQKPTYERAGLLNNMSLLYIDRKEFTKAEDCLLEALDILSATSRVEEMATTKVNIGNLCYYRGKFFRGLQYMEDALHLYEQPDVRSVHYASALSGMAEGYFHIKEYEDSLKYYDQCLTELDRVYGRNAEYEKVYKNRKRVQQMADLQNERMPMEKIRKFVEENFLPVLKEKYGEYPVAVGLVGEGSQCYGYDDKYSVDHDYGMGFCVWMSEETYRKVGTQLQKEYENITEPYSRITTEEGQGRVGVMTTDSFIQRISGVYPVSEKEWMTVKEEQLSAMTNGEIFYDPYDIITSKINNIRKYPENIKMKKLAVSLHEMAQSGQYNYLRCYKRKDEGAMLLTKQAFVDATIQTAYLLNDMYKPFYKWTFRKMEEFTVLKELPDLLVKLMETDVWDPEVFERIEEVCELVAKETEKLGFTLNHSFLDGYSRQIAEKYHG